MVGAGLLAVAGILYASGPTEQNDARTPPLAAEAVVSAGSPLATPSQAPEAKPQAMPDVPKVAVKTEVTPPVPSGPATALPLPRLINGPMAGRAPITPAKGPKNDDVPPVQTAPVQPVVAKPPAGGSPAPAIVATKPDGAMATRAANTGVKAVRKATEGRSERPAASSRRPILTADASPAPRESPAPRVQW